MAARLQPRAQQCDVSGSSDTVSAFDDDQFAGVFSRLDARKRRSIGVLLINELFLASS
jgi:hypothetical protein